jgi:hypothetical protein
VEAGIAVAAAIVRTSESAEAAFYTNRRQRPLSANLSRFSLPDLDLDLDLDVVLDAEGSGKNIGPDQRRFYAIAAAAQWNARRSLMLVLL